LLFSLSLSHTHVYTPPQPEHPLVRITVVYVLIGGI
jgi:hypothetical protein